MSYIPLCDWYWPGGEERIRGSVSFEALVGNRCEQSLSNNAQLLNNNVVEHHLPLHFIRVIESVIVVFVLEHLFRTLARHLRDIKHTIKCYLVAYSITDELICYTVYGENVLCFISLNRIDILLQVCTLGRAHARIESCLCIANW
ncbi:hypothetical protein Tcan_01553, partial [Toxocara canis]